jgi:hypothetical protein
MQKQQRVAKNTGALWASETQHSAPRSRPRGQALPWSSCRKTRRLACRVWPRDILRCARCNLAAPKERTEEGGKQQQGQHSRDHQAKLKEDPSEGRPKDPLLLSLLSRKGPTIPLPPLGTTRRRRGIGLSQKRGPIEARRDPPAECVLGFQNACRGTSHCPTWFWSALRIFSRLNPGNPHPVFHLAQVPRDGYAAVRLNLKSLGPHGASPRLPFANDMKTSLCCALVVLTPSMVSAGNPVVTRLRALTLDRAIACSYTHRPCPRACAETTASCVSRLLMFLCFF